MFNFAPKSFLSTYNFTTTLKYIVSNIPFSSSGPFISTQKALHLRDTCKGAHMIYLVGRGYEIRNKFWSKVNF